MSRHSVSNNGKSYRQDVAARRISKAIRCIVPYGPHSSDADADRMSRERRQMRVIHQTLIWSSASGWRLTGIPLIICLVVESLLQLLLAPDSSDGEW